MSDEDDDDVDYDDDYEDNVCDDYDDDVALYFMDGGWWMMDYDVVGFDNGGDYGVFWWWWWWWWSWMLVQGCLTASTSLVIYIGSIRTTRCIYGFNI